MCDTETVWLLTTGAYENEMEEAAYTTRESAETAAAQMNAAWEAEFAGRRRPHDAIARVRGPVELRRTV